MSITHSTVVVVADDGTSPVGSDEWNAAHVGEGAFEFVIDGGAYPITSGVKFDLEIPFAGTIASWTLLADRTGSIVVDLWKDTYANFPPDVTDTIIPSGTKPTLASAVKATSANLTGWTTSFAKGDILRVYVEQTPSLVQRVTLSLKVLG